MAGHTVTRRRDPRVTATAVAVVLLAVALDTLAVLGAGARPWTPLAVPIGVFVIVALIRPLEPAPGEKFTLGAAVAFFAATVLPGLEAVVVVTSAALIAKIVQRASPLSTAVNVAIMSAATAAAATVIASFKVGDHVPALALAGAAYTAVTLAGVGSMIAASQGLRALRDFVGRELLPTLTLVSVGAIGALIWERDVIAILILAIPLAAIERGLRVAARERTAVAALREANEAQRQFTEDAAHEIRTPLTALIGDLAYVRAGSLGPAEAEALSSAQRTAGSLQLLTDRLLAFARAGVVAAPQQADQTGPAGQADLADVAREIVARLDARPGVAVRLAAPAGLEAAVGPELLRAVVQDVVANAVAYTETGTIELAVEERGGSAVLRVSDTGIGIPAEELARVFDRFYRGARARALAPGSGLGLAIVRRIVEAHGGSVTLTSAVGGGTTVQVELPRPLRGSQTAAVLERS